MLLLALPAFAQSETPAPAEEEPIELSPDAPVGSALDEIDQAAAEISLRPDQQGLDDVVFDDALPSGLVRGRLFVRPRLSTGILGGAEPSGSVWAGGTLGHQWWTLSDAPVVIGGETRLEMSAPVGGAVGRRLVLSTRAGPWFGPIGLRVGPSLRWDREEWGDQVLENAGQLGLGGALQLDAGSVVGWVGAEPSYLLWGSRSFELTYEAGLGTWLGPLLIVAEGQHRSTEIGPRFDVGLLFHLQLFHGGS